MGEAEIYRDGFPAHHSIFHLHVTYAVNMTDLPPEIQAHNQEMRESFYALATPLNLTLLLVFLAVRGKVYDVTSGRNFYGPGGPYENFAGRDATRGLACQSFDEDMLTKDLDGPLDPCDDLPPEQLENLKGWIERFDEKYLVVGKLVPFKKTDFH